MNSQTCKQLMAAAAVLLGAAGGLSLAGWYRQANTPAISMDFVMDTLVEQKLYGKQADEAVSDISAKLKEFEQTFSMHLDGSEISKLNAASGNPIAISDEVYALLERGKELSLQSRGAFDLTIAPLTQVWGITSENPTVPSVAEISSALELVNASSLILENGTAQLSKSGQAVDLGGLAKGAACDIVRESAELYGIDCGYVSIGGNMVVLEKKPLGRDFYFGIRDPKGGAQDSICAVTLYGKTMATTGTYERYFEEDGMVYHHVLDPKTGWPADSDLLSVTVISEDGTLADFLSTTLFVLGKDTVLDCLERNDFQLIAVGEDGVVYCSSSLESVIFPTETSTNYEFVFGERE